MFLHINYISVLPQNHRIEIQILPQDKDSLLILLIDKISLLTAVLDLSPQANRTLLFIIHIIQNITPAPFILHNKVQPISRNSPRSSTPLLIVEQIADKFEFFEAACSNDTMTDDQFLNYCNHSDVGIVETAEMMNYTQTNTSCFIPLIIPLNKPAQKAEQNFLDINSFCTQVQPLVF